MNSHHSRHERHRSNRHGAVIVESAIIFSVFATILIGGLDLSLAVMRENALAEAARRLARAAIVHGESSAAISTPWGPTTHTGTADQNTDYAAEVRDILLTMSPADVTLTVEWPDGGNAVGDRVRATANTSHQPMITSLFGFAPYTLEGTSTMRIEH